MAGLSQNIQFFDTFFICNDKKYNIFFLFFFVFDRRKYMDIMLDTYFINIYCWLFKSVTDPYITFKGANYHLNFLLPFQNTFIPRKVVNF